jgi:amino acid transporter
MQPILLLAFAMGVMLSPDSLILLGNTLGSVGITMVGSLLVAGGLHVMTALTYDRAGLCLSASGGEAHFLHLALGALPATVLPLCARVVYTVCVSTGILAIAGYVFNEVFVYWFPNLGFSFFLLGGVLALNLAGQRVVALAQIGFVALALVGLVLLSSMGLLWLRQTPPALEVAVPSAMAMLKSLLTGLLLFVGFDLALFVPHHTPGARWHRGILMTMGIGLAGLMFGVWGLASVGYVPPTRLADSTIPHMLTARAILGQSGRVVMGVVVLAGTCGTVHALLSAGSHMLAHMARQGLLPAFLGRSQARPALILLALGPAVMLAMGMAGEPETEVYTRAGVLFWLLHYAAVHLAVLVMQWRQRHWPLSAWVRASTIIPLLSLCLLSIGVVGLVWIDNEATHLLLFMLSVSVSVVGLTLANVAASLTGKSL